MYLNIDLYMQEMEKKKTFTVTLETPCHLRCIIVNIS